MAQRSRLVTHGTGEAKGKRGLSLVLVVCGSPGCGALRPGDLDVAFHFGWVIGRVLPITDSRYGRGGPQAVTFQGNLAGLGWWEGIAVGEGIGGKVLARGDWIVERGDGRKRLMEDLRNCRLNIVPLGRYTGQGVGSETDSRRSSGSAAM